MPDRRTQKPHRPRAWTLSCLALSSALVACGGGGDAGPTAALGPSPTPTPPPASSSVANACFDPAEALLTPGFTTTGVYDDGSALTGDMTITETIDGPGVFEGQTRTQRTVTTSTTAAGNSNQRVLTVMRAYQQSSGGLLTQYGNTATFTQVDGGVSRPSGSSKAVNTPPYVDKFYRLALGESTTVSVTAVVTANPPPPQFSTTTTNTFTETTTYVGNETVTVFGRSFNTCKYVRNTVPANGAPSITSTGWRMLGKGVVVKLESTSAGTTTLLQLKSGTLNGVPI
jgi:hypothetical protein